MKAKLVLTMLFVGLMTMGFDCVNENFLIAVNIEGVTGTYNITSGSNPSFNGCATFRASDYLDLSFASIRNARIYDIRVSTLGGFPGASVRGDVQVKVGNNSTTILSFSGLWSEYNSPKSLVTATPPLISRSPAGLSALVNAINNRQDFELCVVNSNISTPVPSGLAVKLEVFGQVDAEP